ncbi:uncharacterized protein LOC108677755 [Hyalella azteca]|uniref:Uncharacterized protein LOC108677755 n=1 Tax=Hyalella azteca TaxID=294128 RepID=A0A8B7P634_HYAAZ|nr:uncharacterized protein LOC108677755 [Hyalella azteca]
MMSYNYDMTANYSYPSNITLNGPNTAAAYSGATFTIDATITDPMGPFTLEVNTPNMIYNKFTVSNLAIVSVGANLGCAGTPVPEYEYFYSVDKRTYHRGVAKFDYVLTGLVYPDLVAELNDPGNKIQLGFTVFFVDVAETENVTVGAGITIGNSTLWTSLINVTMGAPITVPNTDCCYTTASRPDLVAELNDPGNKIQLGFTVFFVDVAPAEIVTVGAGITIGTSTLWTSLINVTMGAPTTAPNTAGTATFAAPYIVGGNGSVAQYGVVTYAVPISITSGKGVKVTCTAAPPADHKITGIMWGNAGANIALRPNLSEGMVWDDTMGVTSWTFYINSTGQITSSVPADTVVLEVSVQYLGSTARLDVTLSCGSKVILTGATVAAGGTADVSVTMDPIYPLDITWFKGDQQALLVKLTFPPGGKAYSNMTIETSGDFDVTAFGAQICKLEILRSGFGVPTLGGRMDLLNKAVNFFEISASSLYNDGGKMLVGAIAGVNRGTAAAAGDNDVVLRMTYFLPKNQTTITSLTYNLSMGMLLDSNFVWAGMLGFKTSAAAPTVAARIISKMIPPVLTTYQVGQPILVKFYLKMAPGSVDKISLVVRMASNSTAVLSLCRIVILAIGSSYPCLDPDPYGKELTNFAQPNTIIHDPVTWGLKATVDFGVLRNVGYQAFYASELADSDAIVLGVLVKGLVVGTDNVTIDRISLGGKTSFNTSLTIAAALSPANTLTAAHWVPLDGTAVAYDGVMKIIDLVLDVPVGYRQPLIVKISNDNSLNMELCFAVVAAVGKNVPCVIPHMIVPVVAVKAAGEEHTLNLMETCYYDVAPGDKNESTISVMAPMTLGRAYATVHSLRWGAKQGKNIGCMLDMINYDVNLLQNSSLSQPMIHTSQTDTLFGDVITAVTKNLRIVRSSALDLAVLTTYLNFTEVPSSLIFSKAANPQLKMTFRVSHVMNSSRQELNGAIVRVLLPKPVEFDNLTDTYSSNITANFTNNHYLDFAISNLFFTDYLEMNVTVSIDPFNTMIKGLGLLDAAALVRIVCTTFADAVPKYCGTTAVLPFQIDGTECSDDLGMDSFLDCQFSASTAISADTGPAYAKIAATGWSPVVRSGFGWGHHITIDFLQKTRVTRITFSSSSVKITQFKIQYSNNGDNFISPCDTVISVTTDDTLLPPACRFEARFGRLIIVDSTPSDEAFVVKFKWYGCALETVADICSSLPTTYSDSPGWRQISHDTVNQVFYYCDYSPQDKQSLCFSSTDAGATWNELPPFINVLIGEQDGIFYASDAQGISTVSSTDGVSWFVTDATFAAGLNIIAKSVPGNANPFTAVTDGEMTADFTGIMSGGAYVIKWERCCS